MSESAPPDLFAFMDAYKCLGVEYTADSSQIRRAHRRLARQHHPDRYAAGSPEQEQATVRMAQINDAYRLVREAPLRYHRVSKGSQPDTAWTDGELDDAIRRSRVDRRVDLWMTIALVVVATVVVPLFVSTVSPALSANSPFLFPLLAAASFGSTLIMWAVLGPRMWRTLFKIDLALAILRLLAQRH